MAEVQREWFVVVPRKGDDRGFEDWYYAHDEEHARRLHQQFIGSSSEAKIIRKTTVTEDITSGMWLYADGSLRGTPTETGIRHFHVHDDDKTGPGPWPAHSHPERD